MSDFFDRQGKPLDLYEWSRKMEDRSYKVVKQEDVGPFWISTVWIGVGTFQLSGEAPPIFETMVFRSPTPLDPLYRLTVDDDYSAWRELDMARYSTEDEARAGHEAMVAKWKLKLAKQADSA